MTSEENLRNSREFPFLNYIYAASLGSDKTATNESKKNDKAKTNKDDKKFDVEKYIKLYNNSIQTVYDKFEKAYRRNQEIINRSSGLINQDNYERLLIKQKESEKAFNEAFKEAKIKKDGGNIEFPDFNFEEIKAANKTLTKWIEKEKENYKKAKKKLR